MTILGISAYYHDSAAAIIRDGNIVAAVQEERFSRLKNDENFPSASIKFCLEQACISINELDAVVFYDKPFLKFERLLETYYAFAPKGILSFYKAMPVWIKEKIFIKQNIRKELKKIQSYQSKKLNLLFTEHHLSHAASAYYPSGFSESAILTVDGVGEWATTTISKGMGNSIEVLKELRFPHSIGLLYSAFTYFLGFKVNSDEYKLMGLAPYGNANSQQTKHFGELIRTKLVDLFDDGSIQMNQHYFKYAYGLQMVHDKKFEVLFGFKKRKANEDFREEHLDLAFAVQQVTEEIVLKLAAHAKEITQSENLCMAGGVALNCVANGKIQQQNIFKDIFVQPAAGDAGGALGAALAGYYIHFNQPLKENKIGADTMYGALLGPSFKNGEIEEAAKANNVTFQKFDTTDDICWKVAELLAGGNVVGWCQGKMEFGPRALGNRSILADPRNDEMQKQVNLKIKFRESFRPFAPAVLAKDVKEYFDTDSISPYMLMVHPVKKEMRLPIPEGYSKFSLMEKLYTKRSILPAITHVDFSARIQTVSGIENPLFYKLITAFKEITGCGILLNTSFNVKDEPIVNTPQEAISCFLKTGMDVLVIENYLFLKKNA